MPNYLPGPCDHLFEPAPPSPMQTYIDWLGEQNAVAEAMAETQRLADEILAQPLPELPADLWGFGDASQFAAEAAVYAQEVILQRQQEEEAERLAQMEADLERARRDADALAMSYEDVALMARGEPARDIAKGIAVGLAIAIPVVAGIWALSTTNKKPAPKPTKQLPAKRRH